MSCFIGNRKAIHLSNLQLGSDTYGMLRWVVRRYCLSGKPRLWHLVLRRPIPFLDHANM